MRSLRSGEITGHAHPKCGHSSARGSRLWLWPFLSRFSLTSRKPIRRSTSCKRAGLGCRLRWSHAMHTARPRHTMGLAIWRCNCSEYRPRRCPGKICRSRRRLQFGLVLVVPIVQRIPMPPTMPGQPTCSEQGHWRPLACQPRTGAAPLASAGGVFASNPQLF